MGTEQLEADRLAELAPIALPLHGLLLDDVRKRLHDLGNCLTGLVGNLELVELSLGDPEIDLVSLEAALEAGRASLSQLRDLRGQLDRKL